MSDIEYPGSSTSRRGRLENDLRRTKGENTLYISHYYFALNDGEHLIFYYNPQFYWDKVPLDKIEDYVWNNLNHECAVLTNVSIDSHEMGRPNGYKKNQDD